MYILYTLFDRGSVSPVEFPANAFWRMDWWRRVARWRLKRSPPLPTFHYAQPPLSMASIFRRARSLGLSGMAVRFERAAPLSLLPLG